MPKAVENNPNQSFLTEIHMKMESFPLEKVKIRIHLITPISFHELRQNSSKLLTPMSFVGMEYPHQKP